MDPARLVGDSQFCVGWGRGAFLPAYTPRYYYSTHFTLSPTADRMCVRTCCALYVRVSVV
jgi:hypothetical protein